MGRIGKALSARTPAQRGIRATVVGRCPIRQMHYIRNTEVA